MMLARTGRKLALMLRTMCIILDKLGTAVLAAPIFLIHTGMLYLAYKHLIYIYQNANRMQLQINANSSIITLRSTKNYSIEQQMDGE